MRRPLIVVACVGAGLIVAFWFILRSPGTLSEALSRPWEALMGTQQHLNATLLEVSENGEPVKAAGRRLLQPFGMVRVVKIYDAEPDASKKR